MPTRDELRRIVAASPAVVVPVDRRGLMAGAQAAMVEAMRQDKLVVPLLLPGADAAKLPLELRALSSLTVDRDERLPEQLAQRGVPVAWIARFEESNPAPTPVPVVADVLLSFPKELEPRAKALAEQLRASGKRVTLADGDLSDSARKIEGARATWVLVGPTGVDSNVQDLAVFHAVESRRHNAIPVMVGADPRDLPLHLRMHVAADLNDPADWPRLLRTLDE